MALAVELPGSIKIVNPYPVDYCYGPFATLAAAKAGVPQAVRYDGLTVQITGSGNYYWTAADLTDTGLIVKSIGVLNTAGNGELMRSTGIGSNASPSGIYADNLGNLTIGTGLSGTIRQVIVEGSSANIGLQFNTKGLGNLIFVGNSVTFASSTFPTAIGSININGNSSSIANTAGSSILIVSGAGVAGNADSGNIILDLGPKAGSGKVGSISIFASGTNYGSGEKVLFFGNAVTNPSTNPTGGGLMFVKSSDNKPYWRTPAGIETVMLSGGAGITNTAAANEIPVSLVPNIGPSGIFSIAAGNLTFGTAIAGATRTLTADGSAADVGFAFVVKGLGVSSFLSAGGLTLGSSSISTGTAQDVTLQGIGVTGTATIAGRVVILGGQSAITGITGGIISIKGGNATVGNANGGDVYINGGDKFGSGTIGNLAFFSVAGTWGGGEKTLFFGDATTIPSTNPTNGGIMFVKSADHKPYWRTPAGVEWLMLSGTTSISGLTVAVAGNTIDNLNFQQEWQWSTLPATTGLRLSSTSTLANSNTQKLFEALLSGANANTTQTTYGGYIKNSHTGTLSTNVGLYVEASGGASNNYAIQAVGLILTTASATIAGLRIGGISGDPSTLVDGDIWFNAGFPRIRIGGISYNITYGPGTSTRVAFGAGNGNLVDSADLVFTSGTALTIGTGAATNLIVNGTASVIGGLTITTGSVLLDLQSVSRALLISRVTNIATVATPVNAMIAYDATTNLFNFRQNGSWVNLGGVSFPLSSSQLTINNPAATFKYTITAAAIAADRTITLPLLTGNDTMVTAAFTQTLTNKTATNLIVGTQALADNSTLASSTEYVDRLTLQNFDSTHDGYVLMSGGGALNFLRADGTWVKPTLSGLNPAVATNTIDNLNFAQDWKWGSMVAGSAAFTLEVVTTGLSVTSGMNVLQLQNSGANSNSGITTYGAYIQNARTGTSSTNIGLATRATGGTVNIALDIDTGNIRINSANVNLWDANNNELLKFTTVGSAVNELTISNNSGGNAPSIIATGTDTNISIDLKVKGTGNLRAQAFLTQFFDQATPERHIDISGGQQILQYVDSGTVVNFNIAAATGTSTSTTGATLNINAGAAYPSGNTNGGHLSLGGGVGFGTGIAGNITIHGGGSYGGGSKVTFIGNAAVVPTSNPTGGGILYVEAGALKYRGSSGTITTLGAA